MFRVFLSKVLLQHFIRTDAPWRNHWDMAYAIQPRKTDPENDPDRMDAKGNQIVRARPEEVEIHLPEVRTHPVHEGVSGAQGRRRETG